MKYFFFTFSSASQISYTHAKIWRQKLLLTLLKYQAHFCQYYNRTCFKMTNLKLRLTLQVYAQKDPQVITNVILAKY